MSIQRETAFGGTLEQRPSAMGRRSPNALLASLPAEEYARLAPHLKRVPMGLKHLLHKQDTPLDAVYFPGGGACTLVKTTEDGRTMEIGELGGEGATVFFGLTHAPCDVVVQMAGPYAEMMPVAVFAREMERGGALYQRINSYSHAFMGQLMQRVACNGLHSAEKRCARWILTAHDRAERDAFPLTHEGVATLLGLRRPTVTLVLHTLRAEGVIEHQRGRITVVDRTKLEARACECYRVIRTTLHRSSERTANVAVQESGQ